MYELVFKKNEEFDRAAIAMLQRAAEGLCDLDAVHFSFIDFLHSHQVYVGVNDEKPVYPASIYKLFVAMAVLYKVSQGLLSPKQRVRVTTVNARDEYNEVPTDLRPVLRAGHSASVDYLLDLMITGSSNTAANVLIDLVGRDLINNLILRYGWQGSEVTRKFLPRELEDEAYRKASPTMMEMRHLAEFFYRLHRYNLIDRHVSRKLEDLLLAQQDRRMIQAGLPDGAIFLHKTGWFDYNRKEDGQLVGVTGDAGIVEWNRQVAIVCCVVALPTEQGCVFLQRVGEGLPDLLIDI